MSRNASSTPQFGSHNRNSSFQIYTSYPTNGFNSCARAIASSEQSCQVYLTLSLRGMGARSRLHGPVLMYTVWPRRSVSAIHRRSRRGPDAFGNLHCVRTAKQGAVSMIVRGGIEYDKFISVFLLLSTSRRNRYCYFCLLGGAPSDKLDGGIAVWESPMCQ